MSGGGGTGISIDELSESIREVLEGTVDLAGFLRSDPAARLQQATGLWQSIASLGWLGLGIEERFGGLGLGFRELGVLFEDLGRYLVPLPVIPTLMCAQAFVLAGSEEQRSRWLPAFASGARRATLALPAHNDTLPVVGADGSVSGRLAHVQYADRVDEILLPVRNVDGTVCLAAFGADSAGVTVHAREVIDLTRSLAEVQLTAAALPPERVLQLETPHWEALLDFGAAAMACDSIGGARHILERTVAYMGTRKQFDRPIGSFQALKHRMASSKIQLEGVTALTRHACELLSAGGPEGPATVSCAKFSACDAYIAIAEDSVQLHGGIGFTWEHECHLFLKRARLNSELFGSSTLHRERVAGLAFGYDRRHAP